MEDISSRLDRLEGFIRSSYFGYRKSPLVIFILNYFNLSLSPSVVCFSACPQ
ncbi:unnamed protein product [Choristocarpus tenellus]